MRSQKKSRRCAIMLANMDRPDSKWFVLGSMDLASAKGQVTRIAKRGGSGDFPCVGYRKKGAGGITVLAFKNGNHWSEGYNAHEFNTKHMQES